jgi:DNA segregation ATPase FtsK/SpoIIIE, S-DNA-T family
MTKFNTLKNQKKEPTKKPKSESTGKGLNVKLPEIKSEKLKRISGVILMASGIFLVLSFISYLSNWKIDQDKVDQQKFFEFVFSSDDIIVHNWMGKFGAFVAHQFIHNWFGIASFLIALFLVLISIKLLFNKRVLPLWKSFQVVAFGCFWIPFMFGYFVSSPNDYLPGAFGYGINNWVTSALGSVGAFVTVLFTLLLGVTAIFNPPYDELVDKFGGVFDKANSNEDEEKIEDEESKLENKYSMPEPSFDLDDNTPETFETFEREEVEEQKPEVDLSFEEEPKEELELEETSSPLEELIIEQPIKHEEIPSEDEGFSVEIANKEETILSEDELNTKLQEFGEYDPKLELSTYELPPIDLLVEYGSEDLKINKEELELNKNKIVDTLNNYNIKISKIKATVGPTVTLYEIIPAPGVRISKIKNLEDDIALSLAALGIRIIAPIPGKGTIGIEVPNSDPDTVSMRTLIASDKFQNSKMDLPVALGKTISNEIFITDLTKMPHLLMAGATGQGKSVGLNAILVSILYKKHPSQVKFVLVDPKKVELTLFNKIERHFLAKLPGEEDAIITDTSKVVKTLNSLCIEMDNRYELLKDAGVRTIKEYNAKFIERRLNPEKGHGYMPYIVLVIDEFADLIMTAGKEVETPIARLAQLARAIGIHLIVATQRPSTNIITGVIKANFPARIAFRVSSQIDSRTILDSKGAEQLIGRGDMLLSQGSDLVRIQCAFVDTPEVDAITDYIGSQRAYPAAFMLPEYEGEEGGGDLSFSNDEKDPLFDDAARMVVQYQQGSASLIQRKMKIGYNRAGRIIDQLEAAGIIGNHQGSKARDVLYNDLESLEQFLRNSNGNSNQTILPNN